MSRGRRYSNEPKLNIKKVIAVIMALAIIVLFIVAITKLLKSDKKIITANTYFSVYTNNKWGVIDSEGNDVIDPSYKEMIVIPNSKIPVFICTYDVEEQNGTYKTKAINSKNEEIFISYNIELVNYQLSGLWLWIVLVFIFIVGFFIIASYWLYLQIKKKTKELNEEPPRALEIGSSVKVGALVDSQVAQI